MNEFEGLKKLILFDDSIPSYFKEDVSKRVSDWLESGGLETDEYIKRQYRYLLEVKERANKK